MSPAWRARRVRPGKIVNAQLPPPRVQATVTETAHQRVAEIAWVVGTAWQGQGIATEAAKGLCAWLVKCGVHTITAHIHPNHRASAAVAAAAGLAPTNAWHDGEAEWASSALQKRKSH